MCGVCRISAHHSVSSFHLCHTSNANFYIAKPKTQPATIIINHEICFHHKWCGFSSFFFLLLFEFASFFCLYWTQTNASDSFRVGQRNRRSSKFNTTTQKSLYSQAHKRMGQKLILRIDQKAMMNKRNVSIEKRQRSLVSHKMKEERLDKNSNDCIKNKMEK